MEAYYSVVGLSSIIELVCCEIGSHILSLASPMIVNPPLGGGRREQTGFRTVGEGPDY